MAGLWALAALLAVAQHAPAKKQYTVDTIYAAQAAGGVPPEAMQWSPDGSKLTYLQHEPGNAQESLYCYDPASGISAPLIAADKLAALVPSTRGLKNDRQRENRVRFGMADYQWSPDSGSLLFDALGQLWLYDLAAGRGRQMTDARAPSSDPKFSPDGKYLSYVRGHNLYLRPVAGGAEVALSRNGGPDLLNGEVDWLYSEELDVRSNYFWSPDASQILYLQMNEAPVPQYPVVDWIPTHPEVEQERYPKAGDPNPTVKLMLRGRDGAARQIDLGLKGDFYIPRFGWARPGLAWAMVLNRLQNEQDLYFINARTGESRRVLRESDRNYIEVHDPMGRGEHQGVRFLDTANQFLWLSWRDGFTHVYLYSFDAAKFPAGGVKLERQLESGAYEVKTLLGVDETAGTVYVEANRGDDRQEHLLAVPLAGERQGPEGGPAATDAGGGVHSVVMDARAQHFVDTYSALGNGAKVQVCTLAGGGASAATGAAPAAGGGGCREIWASHTWDGYDTLVPQFADFKAEDGQVLHGVILLPPAGVATEVNGKVPLILNPYGGPQGQSVRDSVHTIDAFDQVLAHAGFAVLKVDNRGTGNRGREFAVPAFHHLGEVELRDNLAALDQALVRFPRLDGTRLGWWGWSYGGTMAAYALTHSDRFQAGISVAPVTDWHNYDTTYTERYMGLPGDNAAQYEQSSVVKSASALHGRLLLVHGSSDDNVHLQNSIQLIDALINAGLPFDFQIYPGKTHGIAGAEARTHLFKRMLWHWQQYLAK
jgi:dipeptidyl-peptidase 4